MSDKDLGTNVRQPKSRTLFKDTLTRALLENDGAKLRKMSERLLEMALSPTLTPMEQLAAIKLIIDRVDGRAKESPDDAADENKPAAGLFKIVKVE